MLFLRLQQGSHRRWGLAFFKLKCICGYDMIVRHQEGMILANVRQENYCKLTQQKQKLGTGYFHPLALALGWLVL